MNTLKKVMALALTGLISTGSFAQSGLEIAKSADKYDQENP